MKNPPDVQLSDLSLDELLSDMTGHSPRPSSPVAKWLQAAGIYPGTARTPATDLYSEYVAYIEANPGITDKIQDIRHWGREMARHFKRGTIRKGTVYYISRRKDPVIPASVKSHP